MRDPGASLEKLEPVHIEDAASKVHPAWREFMHFCRDLQYGEIERLSIQDGLPVLAEVARKKIKFK